MNTKSFLNGGFSNIAFPLVFLILLGGIWQFTVALFQIPSWLLPSPIQVFEMGWKWKFLLASHTAVTFYESFLGFLLAVAVGVPLAIAITWSVILRDTLYPILVIAQSIPKVAVAPLFLIWIGYGLPSKVLIAFLVAFFPIVIDTATGLQEVEDSAIDLLRSLNASKFQIFQKVRIPNSLPNLFSGLKVGVTLSVVGAVIGEFVGSNQGLGYLILSAAGEMNTSLMFACIVLLALLGVGFFYLIWLLEKLMFPWRRSPDKFHPESK